MNLSAVAFVFAAVVLVGCSDKGSEPVQTADGLFTVQIRTRGEPADPGGPEDEPRPNARVGLIAEYDVDAWWPAITDDVDGARSQYPPGAQIRSTVDRLSASPAQWYDTDGDGEVTVEVEPGNYLLCAVTTLDPEKLAGCGEVDLTTSLEIKVLYADGQIFVQPDSR